MDGPSATATATALTPLRSSNNYITIVYSTKSDYPWIQLSISGIFFHEPNVKKEKVPFLFYFVEKQNFEMIYLADTFSFDRKRKE